ncbi:MAG: family 16 glycoside hydrolase [Isosphaeraceae bacterium]
MLTPANRWIGVRFWVGLLGIATVAGLLAPTLAVSADLARQVWDFNADVSGAIAKGFTAEIGAWSVATETGTTNQVLAQTAKSPGPVFNIAVVADGRNWTDVDLSVRVKPVAGVEDQSGGVVWRFQDVKNYYVARYNPLEDNYRLYKVVGGKRTQLATADIPGDQKWHTVRVMMKGAKITCALDGKTWLEADDATFVKPGKIGLWSKADAQSWFDDLTVSGD